MRNDDAVGRGLDAAACLDRPHPLAEGPQPVRPEMAGRYPGPVLDPDRADLPERWCHLDELGTAVRRHVPAGRCVAVHGDGAAGKEKVNHMRSGD
jgi:hypothetical protein